MDNKNKNQMPNNNNGPKMNMPRFNMNWIYAIAILALGLLWFSSGGPQNSSIASKATYSNFKTMVDKGYASKIVVNKNQNTLRMYVKPEHIRDVFHQSAQQTGNEPYLEVEIGSSDQVEEFVNAAREAKTFTGDYSYENRRESEMFNMILYNILPFALIIGLYFLFIRRMGGGGMGAGGGVFSVGKSKAKMYEKGGDLGITFKDVADRLAPNRRYKRLWIS